MNAFDGAIIGFFNQFAQRSEAFDRSVAFLSGNHLLKGGVLTAIIWWSWFRDDEHLEATRNSIIATLISSVVAAFTTIGLTVLLPFRLRPIHQEDLHLQLPSGMDRVVLDGWSSLPSDHATLFAALAVGIFLFSRKIGILAIAYTTLFILLPRIYLGLHFPTDIIAGALVGTIVVVLGNRISQMGYLKSVQQLPYTKPEIFYPLFFLFTFQIADMFDSSRAFFRAGGRLIHMIS